MEVTSSNPFETKLAAVSSLKLATLRPLDLDNSDLDILVSSLTQVGYNISQDDDTRTLLLEKKLASLEKGRGLGLVRVIGSEKARHIYGWSQSHDTMGIIVAADDLATIAVFSMETSDQARAVVADKIVKLNQRVRRGLEAKFEGNPGDLAVIAERFASVRTLKSGSALAPLPPGSLFKLWRFMLQREI